MRITLFLMVFLAFSCEAPSEKATASASADEIVRQFWPNGNPRTEIPMKNEKKHGTAKSYYQDGAIRQEIEYVLGLKQGESIFYYETGKPYRVTQYVANKIHGVRKLFWENGNLKAEIPYYDGIPCSGLKEYQTDGSPKTKYPKLVIQEIDESLTRELVTLIIKPSEKVRKIEFYYGILGVDGCFDEEKVMKINPQSEQEWKIYYPVPKGSFIMKEVSILVKITTNMGNPYFIQKTHNLAVENRG